MLSHTIIQIYTSRATCVETYVVESPLQNQPICMITA